VVDAIVLLRPAAITHAFNADQRYIELGWSGSQWNTRHTIETFTMSGLSDDLGPPGYYMLYVVEHDAPGHRSPSAATFLRFY
jgi:hypothetical protein